jgi:PRTRC genetic system protein A
MHPADAVLQQSMPSVMVPRFGALPAMQTYGERVLIGGDAVYLEIYRPWVRLVRKLGGYFHVTALPYGNGDEATDLHCGRIPPDLIGEFVQLARQAHPNETGAWIVWNSATETFRLIPVGILEHGPGHLRYDRPVLGPEDALVVDCHSHGRSRAFFSDTDDRDDCHDVKFAFVVGNCGRPNPSFALRLCAKGILEEVANIPSDWYAAARDRSLV